MSRSKTDATRREIGKIIKPVRRKEVNEREDMVVTEKGCEVYGNFELMKVECVHCVEKNCY